MSTSSSCSRAWEVAAARDGRLHRSLDTDHVESCEACQREQRALEDLRERLSLHTTAGDLDTLTLRRLRGRVLEAADEALLERASVRRPRVARVIALLVAALIALTAVFLAARRNPPMTAVNNTPTTVTKVVVTSDEATARWSSTEDGPTRRWIDLQDGALRIVVDRPEGGARVIVRVPDGEIEDTGTTFHVTVKDGHTTRVHVTEGSVVLCLTHTPALTLRAGEMWNAPTPPANVAPPPSSAAPPPRPSFQQQQQQQQQQQPPLQQDQQADEEDRAYVEVIRLMREGRDNEAKGAAIDYLRRFPNGFRRVEVERITQTRSSFE